MGSEGSTAAVEAAFRNDCNWQADKARKGCFNCETTFTLITRRHHCRCCGEVFCPQCWGSKEVLPMSLFPSTQRLVQRIKDTIPYDEKLHLNERLKQPQPVCRCCLAVITGLAGPLREGVELRLIRVGLKPCADDEAESGRATAINFNDSASASPGPTECEKDGNGQPVPTGAGPGAPSTEVRRHRSFGCDSVDVQPYEREGTAVYCEGGDTKTSTVVVCSGAPVEETSPQVRLQSPAVAETSSPEGVSEGRYEEGPPPTSDRTEGAPGQRLVEDGSSRKMKYESVGIRWSAVSAQCFLVNIAGWRPFNRGTHLRFTSPGRSGLLHSTSSTIPSFTDATIPIVMSLAAPPHDHHDACQFIPSSESYPDLGSASLGERPVTPPPSATGVSAIGVSGSVGSGSALPGATTLVTVNGDSFALRSALKRGSSKRDKRDLHLKRSESVENFQFETLLPPVWRLSLRAIQKCSVAVHDHSAQTTPTLQLETESQILIFSATDNFSLSRMERAITAAVELSRVRARIHIAAPK